MFYRGCRIVPATPHRHPKRERTLKNKRGIAIGALLAVGALSFPAAMMTTATATERTRTRTTHSPQEFERVDPAAITRMLQSVGTTNRRLAQSSGVGTQKKVFVTLDFVSGAAFPKLFKLRGKSRHMEIWVAADSDDVSSGIRYPAGDCRNDDPARLNISDRKINYFMRQFETNILPKESKWL